MEIVLEARHTHLYPGLEGLVAGDDAPAPSAGAEGLPSRIAFSDGAMAAGTLKHADGAGWELEVGPYTTAAGTHIAARKWRIAFRRENGRTAFRVERKLAVRD